MEQITTNMNRGEKVISLIYKLSGGVKKRLSYEDIVVGLFREEPEEFHLRGYPEYPDSTDSIQRMLYEYKSRGYIEASNKVFSLTNAGIDFAERLLTKGSGPSSRQSRAAGSEFERISKLEGFSLYLVGKNEQLTDSDFFNYLGTTAKTSKSNFAGRLQSLETVVSELEKDKTNPLNEKIAEYHRYLMSKHKETVKYFS
jgi:hypothetical protein